MAVAIDQHHGFKHFSRSQRCKLQSFGHIDPNIVEVGLTSTFSHSLELAVAVQADNIHRSVSTPCLPLSGEDLSSNHPRVEIVRGSGAPVHALVVEVAIAMASGVQPTPLPSGLGGAYVFPNQSGNNIAVAKPIDEEPLAFNNPKGLGGHMLGQPGLKKSIRIGETGIRELGAYLLDHGGMAGVPPTALVQFSHAAFFVSTATSATTDSTEVHPHMPKIASLQRFVGHGFDAGELGPSFFSVDSVHHIGILDIRILNLDRHAGNMLVMKHEHNSTSYVHQGVFDLVPIDHGFCLPEWLDDPYFEWLHWPQASIPFSENELEYISKLDPFKDAEILRTEIPLLRESSIRVLIVCTIFLKHAAAAGLCLADIGQMMTRELCGGEESASEMENICLQVKARVSNNERCKEETEGGSICDETGGISFGDLNQGEWESFLEIFNDLLHAVFEEKKCKN
ncbi:phosphatidylinositol 4-kinase gamma 1-like [Abrus precatorius]|uniref:1-phosphatidylinositol 4-kinase n=1 Tax=Abrus precatorius TaxID=3816 RepID=A0A8B8L4J5_ABRPR|nr:phosphatidylinositol 4-kinase gamma 1-like [Abrus precatorius]